MERYTFTLSPAEITPDENGNWVAYEDYAKLKDKVEKLKEQLADALQDAQEWKDTNKNNYDAYVKYYKLYDKLQAHVKEEIEEQESIAFDNGWRKGYEEGFNDANK